MSFKDVYKGKRVLVTGHTGFKGSWLTMWLKQLGADVHGVALAPKTENDNFVVTGLEEKINHHICNIKERKPLETIFQKVQPEIVFHLAAQALVKNSFDDPADTFETNLLGTVHVLEAVRRTPSVKTAVMITSDKCYKNVEWEWGYRETDELGGLDPYGASKACAELAIQSYRESFFNETGSPVTASTRAGNVIGGGDWSEKRIVPDIIRALMAGKPVELRSPQATRPWQFVLEPLSGYLWLGAKMNMEGDLTSGWNFGPEVATTVTVGTLTEKIINVWGSGGLKDISDKTDFHEATLLSLDISKARYRLGWQPTLTLDETIEFTTDWYKQFNKGESMAGFGEKQIQSYTQKALERGIEWAK
ncbi:MAG: CDP-glucose 4,6-dehydratase [bacterium]|nr:CDP-glucose 4,6-dehydratase [bacterium]